jgi:hypothetical protein
VYMVKKANFKFSPLFDRLAVCLISVSKLVQALQTVFVFPIEEEMSTPSSVEKTFESKHP